MVDVVRTNFAPIFSDFQFFSAIRAPIVAPTSDNFENCSIGWKGLFSRKKRCKPHLNRPTNTDSMSCGSNSTMHQSSRRPTNVTKSEKHHTSSSHADGAPMSGKIFKIWQNGCKVCAHHFDHLVASWKKTSTTAFYHMYCRCAPV